MAVMNNFGPIEALIAGVACMATVVVPIGVVIAVVYWGKRRPPGPPRA